MMSRWVDVSPSLAFFALLLVSACEGRELIVFEASAGGDTNIGSGGSSTNAPGGFGGAMMPGAGGAFQTTGGAPPGSGGSSSEPGGGPGQGGGPTSIPCTGGIAGECPDNWFCEKPSCTATMGLCSAPKVFCDSDPSPVCGCNGVTYLNDCVRRQMGVNAEAPGPDGLGRECEETAIPCDTGTDCPALYASCSRLVARGGTCRPSQGTCWVVPALVDCNRTLDQELWQDCMKGPSGEPPPPCLNTCEAIASERPMLAARDPQMCTGP